VRLLGRLRPPRWEPWPPDVPVRFVTSFNERLFEASGERCVESFRRHNPSFDIAAYIEAMNGDGVERMETALAPLMVPSVRLDDLPLLSEFFTLARDVIPQELGGDAPADMFPGTGPETGDVWFRKHMFRWFRKIVALDHAAKASGGVLFWMDCDCFSTAPLPREVIEQAFAGAGVVYMRSRRKHTETGLVGYNLDAPGVRELIERMKRHYLTREFERHPRWDDCITLDLYLKERDAPASRDVATRVLARGEVISASPFGPYVGHDKGLHSRGLGIVS
jgi:hypothetical protein